MFYATDHPYEGEDFQSRISLKQHPWTPEWFREVSDRILAEPYDIRPPHEFHSPACPKWLTKGKKACRCGACPLEAIFEDAMAPGGAWDPARP